MTGPAQDDVAHAWERRYADREHLWSGRVNGVLADVAAGLVPGRAADLGCGEGGDVIWLAEHGWRALGVDVSPTAVERAGAETARRGLNGRARFIAADLATWDAGDALFDLVTVSYLHSWDPPIPRTAILRRAAATVAPGGRLLVTSHAAPPPWAGHGSGHGAGHGDATGHHAGREEAHTEAGPEAAAHRTAQDETGTHDHAHPERHYPTPAEDVAAALGLTVEGPVDAAEPNDAAGSSNAAGLTATLDPAKLVPGATMHDDTGAAWTVEEAAVRHRQATGPNGITGELADSVVLLRRESRV